jgi:hypothetical protein
MPTTPEFDYITGEALRALEDDCQDVIDFARRNFGVDLAFNDQSIIWLSSFIEEHRHEMDADTRHAYAVKIAIFLGFAIIHHHGGHWVSTGENNIAVRFPSGAMAFPLTKADKQFENGIADNIYGLYRNIGRFLDPNKLQQGLLPPDLPPGTPSTNIKIEPPSGSTKRPWWRFW